MIKTSPRFEALDVLRGMTICFMIIVNDPGGDPTFWPLDHAKWFGFTPTDLVFPTFLFVVGNAMSFSMKKYEMGGTRTFFTKLLRRSFLIFFIGFLI
jgi:predicted acyltransferase